MKLLILGAGQYGKLVKEISSSQFDVIDFLDDNSLESIGKLDDYQKFVNIYEYAIVAIGNNEVRLLWLNKLVNYGFKIPKIISDKAYISPSSLIEDGVIIEPMSVIQAESVVRFGSIISSGAIVNHNSVVLKGSHIDCNSVVGAGAVVPEKTHLLYNSVIFKK